MNRSGRGNESERRGLVASSTTGSDSYLPHAADKNLPAVRRTSLSVVPFDGLGSPSYGKALAAGCLEESNFDPYGFSWPPPNMLSSDSLLLGLLLDAAGASLPESSGKLSSSVDGVSASS